MTPNGDGFGWDWPPVPNCGGAGCDCPVFPNCGTAGVVVAWGVVVGVEPVAEVDGLNPNMNFGALSAGLEASETEGVFVVVVALEGLKADVGFVMDGAGAGKFVV